jgi:hypothetical protein
MPFDASPYFAPEVVEGLPVKLLTKIKDPAKAALEIGVAAAEALTAAGNRA